MGWFGQGPERAAGEPAPASIVKVSKVELAPPAGAKISKANKFAKEKGLSPKETPAYSVRASPFVVVFVPACDRLLW